ncbi:hypothetical protein FQA47_023857 [Oryzias melastigma]|uniref:Uncharacterized protein n=1 Tax=Oryzias melastigma TaxID=30732 RepID=A0A834CBK1_ORYME|nr:hypothetical protein FQA47_023857 [Oryzias melastigma]
MSISAGKQQDARARGLGADAEDAEERCSVNDARGEGRPSSYLNAELPMRLSGHGTRDPKQDVQPERCRVKTIRWRSFTGGY